jgi:hypothetical protein
VHKGDTSSYVRRAILTALKHKHICNGHGERNKQRAANFCWMNFILLAPVDAIEFQIAEAYSNLDLTGVKYNNNKEEEEEEAKLSLCLTN